MSSWKQTLRTRLRNERGETITEVLAAIVISGLAILMLATVISAAVHMNKVSSEAMNDYYTANDTVAQGSSTIMGTISITLNDSPIALSDEPSITVVCRVGQQVGNTLIVAYAEEGK